MKLVITDLIEMVPIQPHRFVKLYIDLWYRIRIGTEPDNFTQSRTI